MYLAVQAGAGTATKIPRTQRHGKPRRGEGAPQASDTRGVAELLLYLRDEKAADALLGLKRQKITAV